MLFFNVLKLEIDRYIGLAQRFLTGGSWTPRGPKCNFWEWELVCCWMYFFSKEPRFIKACECYYTEERYWA